ncbi:pilin [Sansalvadorimonas sp. 2012CJ34-2]|uniref:Pilin n=1 Tax=Parendozoicomonas callyspongiae TaxID=2942213 RepID=A0ABT0PCD2_9GAMM|nr:pilin [Sansalvadorimonas sp. 2012CJ34-2]
MAEGLQLASAAKGEVTEYYSTHGEFPTSDVEYMSDYSHAGSFRATRVTWSAGRGLVEIWFGSSNSDANTAEGILWLTPTVSGGSIEWTCHNHTDSRFMINSPNYLPANCR